MSSSWKKCSDLLSSFLVSFWRKFSWNMPKFRMNLFWFWLEIFGDELFLNFWQNFAVFPEIFGENSFRDFWLISDKNFYPNSGQIFQNLFSVSDKNLSGFWQKHWRDFCSVFSNIWWVFGENSEEFLLKFFRVFDKISAKFLWRFLILSRITQQDSSRPQVNHQGLIWCSKDFWK